MGFPTSHQNGDKLPKLDVFWTISTIQDEKSAARFRYIKTVSGKVVAQSIAFRVLSTYWHGDDLFPPEILAPSDLPPPEGSESSAINILAWGLPLPPEILAPSDLPPSEGSEF